MDGGILTWWNMLVSYLFAFILLFSEPAERIRLAIIAAKLRRYLTGITSERKKIETAVSKITRENLSQTIRSIEDKCKAINSVIGRVYSNKKGGSIEIRQHLSVPREWYNRFSELTKDLSKKSEKELLGIILNIHKKVMTLELKEYDVFKTSKGRVPVERDFFGQDRIIDVLARNDKDPVKEYHKAAKQVCEDVIGFLNKDSASQNNTPVKKKLFKF